MIQCTSTSGQGRTGLRCQLGANHHGPHGLAGSRWPNDAEPTQTRPESPVVADTAPAAMPVPGNGTEALSAPVVVMVNIDGKALRYVQQAAAAKFPPPTVPRCDGCKWWSTTDQVEGDEARCGLAGLGNDPMYVHIYADPDNAPVVPALYTKPDHYCAAHEPATKETA